ncbi:PQQ-binding-like beta-propeller repeat protein [Rubinisphaera sp.]|uniref:outer membrane protein assembly factor BamB family protein n=1 Tax=Rubinisphaera sp. TaxID=2024857 RepID=UPI000C1140D0|nr:PQQ-binding-like beta-propeller repeat protein [Rubinisphaera sp.]MBV12001.1 hypothetical protein [Rubinisphaera sp.]HCS52556.1 hypothetical protein [Planctomycetaceae bacterium]|tara:strand:+ start:3239 stop:6634 length:3396 start_codon:yes stop_codon:yes gene_type:complete
MAYLDIYQKKALIRQLELMRNEPVTIGQHSSNVIVIEDDNVATLYARILWNKRANCYEISSASEDDLVISGENLRSKLLRNQDEIEIADFRLIFFDRDLIELVDPSPKKIEAVNAVPEKQNPKPDKSVQQSTHEKKKDQELVKLSRPKQVQEEESVKAWLTRSRRPGEREAARSPLVTTLTIVAILLSLAAGGVYLLIGRQSAQMAYQAARNDRDQKKFSQAIPKYEKFLTDFPTHKLADTARIERDLSQIDKTLTGAGADLNSSIEAIRSFVERHRSREDFRDWYPLLATYSRRVSLEGYRQASRKHDPEFVKLGDEGRQLFGRFKANDGSDAAEEQEIAQGRRNALADLLEFDVKQKSLAELDRALNDQNSAEAFHIFRNAVNRYPVFSKQNEFISRIQQALSIELKGVQQIDQDLQTSSETEQKPAEQKTYLIDLQSNRLDIQADGKPVWLVSDNNCFAVERMTGLLKWITQAGRDRAFDPLDLSVKFDCWLVSTQASYGLSLVRCSDGEILWKTLFKSPVTVEPTISGSVIYVVTEDQRLTAIDADSGELMKSLEFRQKLSAPVAELDSRMLCCVGSQDVVYLIDRQTWECVEVRYYGQAPQTITSRPLIISKKVLVVENDQLRTGRIRVLELLEKAWDFNVVHAERLPGRALGHPVLWGDRLFLEMNGPQIAAWQLSDDPGDAFLKRITNASIPYSADVRLYLKPFEGDRVLIAGENLRRMTLLTNAFAQTKTSIELGHATQRIQMQGIHAYVAGVKDPEIGSQFFHYNSQEDETYWRMNVSCDLVGFLPTSAETNSTTGVDQAGRIFQLNRKSSDLNSTTQPIESLFSNRPLQQSGQTQIHFVRDISTGQTLVLFGNEVKRINPLGQVEHSGKLSELCLSTPAISGGNFLWVGQKGIHLTSMTDFQDVADPWFTEVSAQGKPPRNITQLISLSDERFIAVANDQSLIELTIKEDPRRHLAETGRFDCDGKIVNQISTDNDIITIATNNGQLLEVDAQSLLLIRQRNLPGNPLSEPQRIGSHLLIEVEDNQLIAFSTQMEQVDWTLSLEKSVLATELLSLSENRILACLQNGNVLVIDSQSGQIVNSRKLTSAASCPPLMRSTEVDFALTEGAVVTIPRNQLEGQQ